MFTANVPLYLRDVTFSTEKEKEETRKIVTCQFVAQPFTPEMAGTVDVRPRLFNLSTGAPLADVLEAKLAVNVGRQKLSISMAPDTAPSVVLRNVKIGPFKIRADKEGPVFAATFPANFAYPSADDLLFLAHGVNEQHFVTFEAEQLDMLTDGTGAPALKPAD
jgi:hypothetical protein